MKLNVTDRLILLNILPKEGDITTLRILRDLTSKLSFSEEELAALQFEQTKEGTIWRREADEEVEIEIGQKANRIIIEAFESLDKQKKLNIGFLPTYDKFVKD